MKRLVSLALILCLIPFAGLPAGAAADRIFTDIPEESERVTAELLARLGIVSGTGGTNFSPNGIFSRAELAVIGVRLCGVFDVAVYGGTVRFPDVRANHWAHRWVNAANDASISPNGQPVMSGSTDGNFRPSDPMLYGHLITVLVKLLGYDDGDVGLNWPHSYIAKAGSLGLNGDMTFTAGQELKRGEASRIVVNFLFADVKGEKASYAESRLGLSVETEFNGGRLATVLRGRNNEILAVLPDPSVTSRTVTVRRAQTRALELTNGTSVGIPSDARVWSWDGIESAFSPNTEFIRGEEVTLLSRGGAVQHILRHRSVRVSPLRLRPVGNSIAAVDENGTEYILVQPINPSMAGRTGLLRLNEDGDAEGFFESDEYTYQSVTVSGMPQLGGFNAEGKFISVPAATPVWGDDAGTWGTGIDPMMLNIRPGETLLLAYDSTDRLSYIARSVSRFYAEEHQLHIIDKQPAKGSNPLASVFGGAAVGAALYKNGFFAQPDMLEQWDVLMYYPESGVVEVNSRHISGYYNLRGLNKIEVMGAELELLPEAFSKASSTGNRNRNLFLLTHDGRVADIRNELTYTSVGLVSAGGVVSDGGLTLAGEVSSLRNGAVGHFHGMMAGRISFEPFDLTGAGRGELDVEAGTLGTARLAPWCVFYDQMRDRGHAVRVSKNDIPSGKHPANKISYAQVSPSGYVTAIVLNDVTGDAYDYGFFAVKRLYDSMFNCVCPPCTCAALCICPPCKCQAVQVFVSSEVGVAPDESEEAGQWFSSVVPSPAQKTVVGITLGNERGGFGTVVVGIAECKKHTGLTRLDFNSDGTITIEGTNVPIAADVQVFVRNMGVLPINTARAHCRSFEVYTDHHGNKVRVIVGIL
jgi:hypothetical protein